MKNVRKIIVISVCLLVILGASIHIFLLLHTETENEKKYGKIASMIITETEYASEKGVAPNKVEMTPRDKYAKLIEQNSDMAGYIYLTDEYQYPILQNRQNQNFYLDHDFYGNSNKNGSIFANVNTQLDSDISLDLLYGHNMRSGQMFGSIKNYIRDKHYLEQHSTIQIDSLDKEYLYKVVGVFQVSYTVFNYDKLVGELSEEDFNYWKENAPSPPLKTVHKMWSNELTIIDYVEITFGKKISVDIFGVCIMLHKSSLYLCRVKLFNTFYTNRSHIFLH